MAESKYSKEGQNNIPILVQAFDAFNRSADKLAEAYIKLIAKGIENISPSLMIGVLECIPEGLVVIDRTYRILAFNQAAQNLMGLSKNHVIGRHCADIFQEECSVLESLKTGINAHGRQRISSGAEVEIYAMPVFDDRKNIIGAAGIIRKSKHTRRRLQKLEPYTRPDSQEDSLHVPITPDTGAASSSALSSEPSLAPILAAIGDIIINIAHRMRSPLSAIQLFAELLRQDLDEDKQEMVDDILVGVHSLDAVLSNLLSFAQPVKPHFQKLDIVSILEESLLFAAPAIKQQNISLIKEYKQNPVSSIQRPVSSIQYPELFCRGDLEQLKQICFNVILNAIQAMPEGGELRIRAFYDHKTNIGKCVNVEIQDNGCGIPEKFMDRIFTPFFTTKEGGTGLGLCIVYRVIQAHQGSIQINSANGSGTNVSIQLPAFDSH